MQNSSSQQEVIDSVTSDSQESYSLSEENDDIVSQQSSLQRKQLYDDVHNKLEELKRYLRLMPLDPKSINKPPHADLESDVSELLEAEPQKSLKNTDLRANLEVITET